MTISLLEIAPTQSPIFSRLAPVGAIIRMMPTGQWQTKGWEGREELRVG